MDIQIIIRHFIEGNATAEERRQFLLWLKEDKEHLKEYRALRNLNNLNIWNIKTTTSVPPLQKNGEKKKRIYILAKEVLKIAAILLIGILSTWYVMEKKGSIEDTQMQTIHVPS